MVRIGLATYFLIVTALGPSLCCCTMGETPTSVPARVPNQTAEKSHSSSPSGCCCHNNSVKASQDQLAGYTSGNPSLPENSCPCKNHKASHSFYLSPDSNLSDYQRVIMPELDRWLTVFIPPTIQVSFLLSQRNDQMLLPFLTTKDLLRIHHILRC